MIRHRNDFYLTGKQHSVRSPYGEVGKVARDHDQLRAEALALTSDKNLNLHTSTTSSLEPSGSPQPLAGTLISALQVALTRMTSLIPAHFLTL